MFSMFSWIFGKQKETTKASDMTLEDQLSDEIQPSEQEESKTNELNKQKDDEQSTDNDDYVESTSSEDGVKKKRNKKGSRVSHKA